MLLPQVVKAMRQLAAQRRLALTGYPLQNNLDEYFELIRWVSRQRQFTLLCFCLWLLSLSIKLGRSATRCAA
jgi:SNF2 family DNA or RNA helicase